MTDTAQCVWNARATLGEGPLWSPKEQALYWVDILNRRLHRFQPHRSHETWQFDEEISSLAERADAPGLIITGRHGFALFDPAAPTLRPLVQPEAHLPTNRFNDGKCDALGRFWAGTVDFDCKKQTGALYRLAPDYRLDCMDANYIITNGPAWSLDHRTMYHSDSARGRVYAFDFDLQSGNIANKRIFLQFSQEDGSPDGMTVDAEGGLWIAHWGAGKVTRHNAQGAVLQTVNLPCSQVTSCAFGGPELTTLYITSARVGLTPEQLEREPLAGGVFQLNLDMAGIPAHLFRG